MLKFGKIIGKGEKPMRKSEKKRWTLKKQSKGEDRGAYIAKIKDHILQPPPLGMRIFPSERE